MRSLDPDEGMSLDSEKESGYQSKSFNTITDTSRLGMDRISGLDHTFFNGLDPDEAMSPDTE